MKYIYVLFRFSVSPRFKCVFLNCVHNTVFRPSQSWSKSSCATFSILMIKWRLRRMIKYDTLKVAKEGIKIIKKVSSLNKTTQP